MATPERRRESPRIVFWIIVFVGGMGVVALLGLLAIAFFGKPADQVIISTLAGTVGGAMTGLPSLLAQTGHNPTETRITNPPSDPVNTSAVDPAGEEE